MAPSPRPATPQLTEHGAFLRRLAWSLLRDAHEAEDVVQDAYVAALERPDLGGSRLRAWLAGVVRNRARRTVRAKSRLRRREARVARAEAQPSAAQVAARVEAHERLAHAVAALEEPGRTAIVLRYLDGLKPRAIARQLDVPVRTVESRLRRAKERLREVLDAASGGEPGAWMLGLVPLFDHAPGSVVGGMSASGAAGAGKGLAAGTVAAVTGATAMTTKGSIVLLGIVCALVGGTGGWIAGSELAAPEPVAASDPHRGELETDDAPTLDGMGGPVMAANEKLEEENQVLTERLEGLRDEQRREKEQLEARIDKLTKQLEATRESGAPRHRFRSYGEALADVDWKKAGQAIHDLAPQLVRLATVIAEGGSLDHEIQKAIQKDMIPLVEIALGLRREGLPGTGGNGPFTHPAVTVNLIDATLSQAGVPLTEEQRERLTAIGDRFIQEDEARRARYAQGTPALRVFIEESRLKDRFYAEVDALVTAEQRKVLHPEPVRDTVGLDLFSSGLLWQGQSHFQRGASREAIGASAAAQIIRFFGAPEGEHETIRAAVEAWIEDYPEGSLRMPLAPIEKMGMPRMPRLRTAWDPMLSLYGALLRDLPQESPTRAKLKEATFVVVPLLIGEEGG